MAYFVDTGKGHFRVDASSGAAPPVMADRHCKGAPNLFHSAELMNHSQAIPPSAARVRSRASLSAFTLAVLVSLVLASGAAAIEFTLQTRDPESGQVRLEQERVDPARIGVVAVDVWNFHWCKTATMRVDAIVPRINKALEAARSLGMTVMLCPSDVVDNYAGYPQREAVFALPRMDVPEVVNVDCPPAPDAGGCACGRERCAGNYGWDGMHPALRIGEHDLMPDTREEVYAICRQRELTHLLYVGFHTQVCLLGKPMGLRNMKASGLRCLLARDMTDAHPGYAPERGFTPDLNTQQVVEHFEKHLAPTIHLADELAKAGKWDPAWVVDPVRLAPWGTPMRPHLFEQAVTVTLETPLQPGAEIRYTLDGTAPSATALLYSGPFELSTTAHLRASAFIGNRRVCMESEGMFVHLLPPPPEPDVHIDDLDPVRNVGFGHTYNGEVRYSGRTGPPQAGLSNLGQELRINRTVYKRGIGVHAPCALAYAIKPEYRRFVALAGADENIVSINHGSNLARFPSVVFKVFIDGTEAAASPVMRVQSTAWRFDVEIPSGAKVISLIAMDAGDGSQEDFANWANAGFIVE